MVPIRHALNPAILSLRARHVLSAGALGLVSGARFGADMHEIGWRRAAVSYIVRVASDLARSNPVIRYILWLTVLLLFRQYLRGQTSTSRLRRNAFLDEDNR
jgi:hypothetical protein